MSAAHVNVSAAVANTWISKEILEHSRVGLTVRPGERTTVVSYDRLES